MVHTLGQSVSSCDLVLDIVSDLSWKCLACYVVMGYTHVYRLCAAGSVNCPKNENEEKIKSTTDISNYT